MAIPTLPQFVIKSATGHLFLALGLASLTAAPCLAFPEMVRVLNDGDQLYGVTTREGSHVNSIYLSTDEGLHWETQDPADLPPALLEHLQAEADLPKVVCVPQLEQICYRVLGFALVEASSDGGSSWDRVWEMPSSRARFMGRYGWWQGIPEIGACLKYVEMSAIDLAILGEGPNHLAVVALRSEGLLLGRYDNSSWEVRAVGLTQPTPIHGTLADLLIPKTIPFETLIAFLAGGLTTLGLSLYTWVRLKPGGEPGPNPPTNRREWIILLVVLLLLCGWLPTDIHVEIPMVGIPLVALILVARVLKWITEQAARNAGRATEGRRLFWNIALGGLLVAAALWLPFALWVLGIIPWHGTAVLLAAVATILASVWGLRRTRRMVRAGVVGVRAARDGGISGAPPDQAHEPEPRRD